MEKALLGLAYPRPVSTWELAAKTFFSPDSPEGKELRAKKYGSSLELGVDLMACTIRAIMDARVCTRIIIATLTDDINELFKRLYVPALEKIGLKVTKNIVVTYLHNHGSVRNVTVTLNSLEFVGGRYRNVDHWGLATTFPEPCQLPYKNLPGLSISARTPPEAEEHARVAMCYINQDK